MALTKAISDATQKNRSRQPAVEEEPGCVYGLVTRKALEALAKDFERLEGKINGIVFGVVVTVLLQTWKTLS